MGSQGTGSPHDGAETVLVAASAHVFGAEPGRLPAELFDALQRATDPATRARLGAALARCWVYSGQQERGLPFAEQALHDAEQVGDPELVADCLDAALATHWGPDQLETRRALALRLDVVAAHVLDPEARLKAHLWGLQLAFELLDVHSMHRHLRALERLGEESARARFFALTRRLTLDLMLGRTDTSAALLEGAAEASRLAGLADGWMVVASQTGYAAAVSADRATCADVAARAEAFALAEGAREVCAEAAFLWTCAGRSDRAAALVSTFRGGALHGLPRDVNWLLTLQCALEAALAVGDREVVSEAARLLTPYSGRPVFNAGGVMFHGLVDDTLSRAADLLGDRELAASLSARALSAYDTVGATWWRDRLAGARPPADLPDGPLTVHLHPTSGGLWLVGSGERPSPVRPLRGFGYLAELLRRPGQALPALELAGRGTGVLSEAGLGEVIDRKALDAYRRRLADLDDDLREAEEWSDAGRQAALHDEREALLQVVAAATGLGGRLRVAGSSAERARVAIQKAVAAAITRIGEVDQTVGRHLKATVRTGRECRYEPGPDMRPVRWVLDERS